MTYRRSGMGTHRLVKPLYVVSELQEEEKNKLFLSFIPYHFLSWDRAIPNLLSLVSDGTRALSLLIRDSSFRLHPLGHILVHRFAGLGRDINDHSQSWTRGLTGAESLVISTTWPIRNSSLEQITVYHSPCFKHLFFSLSLFSSFFQPCTPVPQNDTRGSARSSE